MIYTPIKSTILVISTMFILGGCMSSQANKEQENNNKEIEVTTSSNQESSAIEEIKETYVLSYMNNATEAYLYSIGIMNQTAVEELVEFREEQNVASYDDLLNFNDVSEETVEELVSFFVTSEVLESFIRHQS